MDSRFEQVNAVAEEALDLPEAEREGFLAGRCGLDEALRASVERLLEMADCPDGFLEREPGPLGEIRPGDVLGGRFLVREELGAGGIGAVYLAEDRELGEVALKVLHPELRACPAAMERFRAEVRAGRAVRHPNVGAVYDLFVWEDGRGGSMAAATMQPLRGETLARRLARGAVAADEAMAIASGIARGIDALHAAGIVHGDLKPDNILLTGGEGGAVPVILDFGLASRPGAGEAAASISGSPEYMAPEQFRGEPVGAAADLYAFGLLLFEMAAGARPFPAEELLPAVVRRTTTEAPRLREIAPSAPRAWEGPIARALARDPGKRPASATQLIHEMVRQSAGGERRTVRADRRCSHRARWVVAVHRRRGRA